MSGPIYIIDQHHRNFEDHERLRTKATVNRDDAELAHKRAKISTDALTQDTRAKDPPIKREEDATPYRHSTHGLERPAPPAPYSGHRPDHSYNGYRAHEYHRPTHHNGNDYARHSTPRMGPYTITNGSAGALHPSYNSNRRPVKTQEQLLAEVCPYELKDEKCPRDGACRMKIVCVVSPTLSKRVSSVPFS